MRPRIEWVLAAAILAIGLAAMFATVPRRVVTPTAGPPDSAIVALARLRVRLSALERAARPDWIDTTDVLLLRARGLSAPVESLRADLGRHPELIPFPGVLGGRMFFSGVHVLDGRWAFAEFEDGHVAGRMLLEYRVHEGRITWRRIGAYLDQGELP